MAGTETAHIARDWKPSTSTANGSTTRSTNSPFSINPQPGKAALTPGHMMGPPSAAVTLKSPTHSAQQPRSPSPNYFGLTVNPTEGPFLSSAARHSRTNWSPPTSDVRSTAAASPRVVPVDQNPEYEAFRRQSETHTFTLGKLSAVAAGSTGRPSTARTKSKPASGPEPVHQPASPARTRPPSIPGDGTNQEQNPVARSPKRLLSSDSSTFPTRSRRTSPASFGTDDSHEFIEARPPRMSLPTERPPFNARSSHRAETLPARQTEPEGPRMVTAQHVINLLDASPEEVLLLDLRVSTQYAQVHVLGALNLCIPTTLLKRPSFNVQKLAETFKNDVQRETFERWRSSKYIIVYDANSSKFQDAAICTNTLQKFANEGWRGNSYIMAGGFSEFASKFPDYLDKRDGSSPVLSPPSLGPGINLSSVPPVIGGCPMPSTKSAANPFFGNIRQNMDLIGGVGQIPIQRPASMSMKTDAELPQWLKLASDKNDNGRTVSEKFLEIEKKEQKRMQEALSGEVTYGKAATDNATSIQIAGIEKGSKNRYNNIWPYEHSRVKLDVPQGICDYVNANHVKAAWSNKHYIATQGPIPATFTDFWNIVWQQDARVIVMLTAEKEGGQVKAHNYWEEGRYGTLDLKFLSEHRASLEPSKIQAHKERRPSAGPRRSTNTLSSSTDPTSKGKILPSQSSEAPYVVVRTFTLSDTASPFERMREITQLQYSSWPDFGAPAHPAHLLGLVEQCEAVVRATQPMPQSGPQPANSRPVIVHCSAGCGRTGTFCTVDSVIDMLKRQRSKDPARGGIPTDLDRKPAGSQSRSLRERQPEVGSNESTHDSEVDQDQCNWVERDDIDLIERTVLDLRCQRISMVQSLRQFVLCYETVLEWLASQTTSSDG